MDRPGVEQLFRTLGYTGALEQNGEWLTGPCPLAPWLHARGTDNNPSFGVHLSDTDKSIFHCFSCHKKGPLEYLLHLLEKYTGENYAKLRLELEKNELYLFELPEWSIATQKKPTASIEPLPEDALRAFTPVPKDHPYLQARGITNAKAITQMELCLDTDTQGDERIVFPVRGVDGRLYGFTGRATNKQVVPRIRDYANLPKKRLLLGGHCIDSTQPILVVEGLFAYATMRDYGFQAVALLHSSVTEHQARLLIDFKCPLYLFLDNDVAGREGVSVIVDKLAGHLPLFGVTYPTSDKDPNGKPIISDPNDLYKQEIEAMIDEAVLL